MFSPRICIGLIFSVFSLSTLAAPPVNTEKTNCPSMEHPRHEPPASAFDDCKGKAEGAPVQHTIPNGEKVNANCVRSPKGLFARPEHPPCPDMKHKIVK